MVFNATFNNISVISIYVMIFFVLKYLMLEVIVRFVDIGGIVDHY
jgi:hypothetical protein